MDEILFSIVVPVYNVEDYLKDCLDSIIKQCRTDDFKCEVILVDDGSTDTSGKICDSYKSMNQELIDVYHNKNQGLLLTRRCGFANAKGKYIVNCDSDDLLEYNMLSEVANIIKQLGEPDVIMFNYNMYDGVNKTIEFENIFSDSGVSVVDKEDVLKEYMINHSIVSMCGKVCKRECYEINKDYMEFSGVGTGEDTLQSIEIFSNANSFVYINQALYNYRIGSGMTRRFDDNYYFTFKHILEMIRDKKNVWNFKYFDFNELYSIKVLQTVGRAITQSRYNDWKNRSEHIMYLKKIRSDDMFIENIRYLKLKLVKNHLQKDHYILLSLFDYRLYWIIVLLLNIKNYVEKLKSKG